MRGSGQWVVLDCNTIIPCSSLLSAHVYHWCIQYWVHCQMHWTHQGQLASMVVSHNASLAKGGCAGSCKRQLNWAHNLGNGILWVSAPSWACTPLTEDNGNDIDYNDPKRVYNNLKQRFEPDTAANRLDKLNKFLNALQSNEEPTVHPGRQVRRLLVSGSYTLLRLMELLCSLRSLGPSFQHIRSRYTSAKKQDAATLEHLLDSPTTPWTLLQTCTLPSRSMHPLQMRSTLLVLRPCLPFAFYCFWCETNGNHFTEECRNMQRSKEQRKANRSQRKAPPAKANLSKPRLQMQHLQSLLVKQVASILPQTSSLITPGTQTQGQHAIWPHTGNGSPITEPIGSLCG